jgi:autotransporter strand-loop-strand O-heptosyltransferase
MEPCANLKDYDFIEIGTSDFDTLIQTSTDETLGISIEPIKYYIDRLPDKPNVIKVQAAVSDRDDFIEIYSIPENKITENGLPYWVRGCNCVGRKHPYVIEKIGEALYDELVTIDRVPTISWKTLIQDYSIKTIKYLKIDTEGYDHVILREYFKECAKNPELYAKTILFEYNQISNKEEIDEILAGLTNYRIERYQDDIKLIRTEELADKAYVLYSTENYFDIVSACVKSIREYSDLKIFVYLLNSDLKIKVKDVVTIRWDLDIDYEDLPTTLNQSENFYINRKNPKIYNILIQRPLITKDALEKYSKTVAYIDSDSIATKWVDSIFDMYDPQSTHPYFVKGIYDYLLIDGRGGVYSRSDLHLSLEHNACELFGVDQSVRENYRQTGYYVAGQQTIPFLEEWYSMCIHPEILNDFTKYAPFHEETLANVLLWKYNIKKGLPYLYVNGNSEVIEYIKNNKDCYGSHIREWLVIPNQESELLFFHGEKRKPELNKMINMLADKPQIIIEEINPKLRILFLAPHLSTGGMPAYLLRRLEELQRFSAYIELFVVEYSDFSPVYVVQKNKIKQIIKQSNYWTLGSNKHELINIIKSNNIDIVHIDEILEGFESFNQVPGDLMEQLFDKNRTWKIVETCHNIWFNPETMLRYHPDAYSFCTPYHKTHSFKNMPSYQEVMEYPIDDLKPSSSEKLFAKSKLGLVINRKHVVNVGLWTPGKNQGELVEVARLLPHIEFHFIGNQAPNFQEYWKPICENLPKNVHIWGEREDVSDFLKAADAFVFNSTWECNPLVIREAASYGLRILARNLPQYVGMFDDYLCEIGLNDSPSEIKNKLLDLLEKPEPSYGLVNQAEAFADNLFRFYQKVHSLDKIETRKIRNVSIIQHFVDNPFLEIQGDSDKSYTVKFFDESGSIQYENLIKSNHWVKLNRRYFTKWHTQVWEESELIYDNVLDLEGKRVYISIESRSLGDSIAWVPYALEFKKKHKCDVIISTFWNKLFQESYPELEFITPGVTVNNIYAMYRIGWFYNDTMEPVRPNTIKLQEAATNILGLEFEEIRPRLDFQPGQRPTSQKYVTIATESTAGLKYWNNPTGWKELIEYLNANGYLVVNVSKGSGSIDGVIGLEDDSIENTMNTIYHSDFFIGLSSGLSWLAWAIGKNVVMISNFTNEDHEFVSNCIRITNPSVCNGCWNNPNFDFDKGDWFWCPIHKNTERHFECSRSISSVQVIDKIKPLMD